MLSGDEALGQATSLMMGFAERSGLLSGGPGQRYLWTDAFAVCNFLRLSCLQGEPRFSELALKLADRVHHVLGRFRTDDPRTGWISGLTEAEGELHPTRGGLRIGKKLPERGPRDPFDEELEWDRDGQYFHYLTRWMHALDQLSRSAHEPRFNLWARELAQVAHASFVKDGSRAGARRMVWKMSTDLSRPLVPSMGQHDPLDGFVTCLQLEATASRMPSRNGPDLKAAIGDFAGMVAIEALGTADPLGLGGLFSDACRVAQLIAQGAFPDLDLVQLLVETARAGLQRYSRHGDWQQPATHRLAFRELGLAIGLSALKLMGKSSPTEDDFAATVVGFWLDPAHQAAGSWLQHRDINEVMLATTLIPEGYLVLSPS